MAKQVYRFVNSKQKNRFLNTYIAEGTIGAAAEACGITRQTHYNWLKEDPEYKKGFAQAKEMAGDLLEEEARRRAVEPGQGVLEDVAGGGGGARVVVPGGPVQARVPEGGRQVDGGGDGAGRRVGEGARVGQDRVQAPGLGLGRPTLVGGGRIGRGPGGAH